MSNQIVQSLFSPTVLGILKTVILAAVPDEWDWLPATVLTVVGVVDDIDAIDTEDLSGDDKMTAVIQVVVSTLDDADDIPGWSQLTEVSRDLLIEGIAEIVVFSIRAAQNQGLPDFAARERFAEALSGLVLAIFELIETLGPKASTVPEALETVGDAVKERLAQD